MSGNPARIAENENLKLLDLFRIKKESYIWRKSFPTRESTMDTIPRDKVIFPSSYPSSDPDITMGLPITTDGVNSKYLGRLPARVGSRPQDFKYPSLATNVLLKHSNWKDANLPDPEKYRVVSGAWPTNRSYVQLISDTSKKEKLFDMNFFYGYRNVLYKYISKLQITELRFPEIGDLSNVEYSPETSPGPRWDLFMKYKTKAQCMPLAVKMSKHVYHNILKGDWVADGLYTVGGREVKKDNADEEGELISSRGILMPEVHEFLLEAIFSRPIETLLNNRDSGPIYLGQSMKHLGWLRLQKDLQWSQKVIEGDWKKFDTSVPNNILFLAFAVLRSFYPSGRKIDNFFLHFISNVVYKKVITPGGFVYSFNSSVPSGSCWTSILNSIVNFLLLIKFADEVVKIPSRSQVRFAIGGDDFLIFFGSLEKDFLKNKVLSLDQDVCKGSLEGLTGMVLKEFLIKDPFPEKIIDCPSFYKTIIYDGVPTIRPDHLIELTIVPLSKIRSKHDPLEFMMSVLASGPGVLSHFDWFFDLIFLEMALKANWHGGNFFRVKYLEFSKTFRRLAISNFEKVSMMPSMPKFVLRTREGKVSSVNDKHKRKFTKLSFRKAYSELGFDKSSPMITLGVKSKRSK
jgi:hypothetical protein